MNILHVLWSAHFGGIERLVLDLAAAQSHKPNFQVGILLGRSEGEMLTHFQRAQLPLDSIELLHGFQISPSKMKKIKDIFSTQDILHFHNFIPIMARAAATVPAAIVYTEHGNFAFDRKMKMHDRLKGMLFKHFISNHVDFMSFNSGFTRNIVERRYDLKSVPRDVVYNGIDFNTRSADQTPIPSVLENRLRDKFVVGTSSRFVGFKRIDRLIDAFADFSKQKNVALLLVGDGPLRDVLEKQVRSLNIIDRTIFAGYQANVHAYQNAMDVCVFPSQYEPFGLAAIETLALGKPTMVLRDSGGMAEVIGNGCREDVVADVEQLAKRLEYYYRQHENTQAEAGERVQFARTFDIEKTATRFARIYETAKSSGQRTQ
jgi:glycosyltransferase involved in cell wall biosynthesis